MDPYLVLVILGWVCIGVFLLTRRAHCPAALDGRHDWLYYGPTANPDTGRPYPYDRKCLACGKED